MNPSAPTLFEAHMDTENPCLAKKLPVSSVLVTTCANADSLGL